ncbi:unnamed protein product [Cladocopium goreaui]|uniref:Type II methyltransferase M.NgoBI (M.NgoBI) (Cytosine-specific methyltransferase NgoBI) (M.NgoI) (Modification methylase NgoBI) n=1 Tax=Cladocopium goreaui TaxID=2562237 RepID=A0A9P1CWE6_9DINO|nr:unnamed protein product [Cladocopium goreaui]
MDEQGLAQHRADRKRGSSLLVPRLQFKRRHMATRKGELKARQFDPRGNAPMIVTGSDCSGLDTATAALKMAGLEPCTVFLSEKDAHARKVLESNYATGGAYAVEGIGPPCQPFSMAGLQNGLHDKRAHVLLRVLQTIKTIQPLTFALENVKPLARHKKFKLLFDFILAFLRSIEDANGEKVYQVECKVLDTSVVGGLPQASVSSLLDCTDVSDLHHGMTTEKGKARVQQHLVSVAKMIQDSILKCSATKASQDAVWCADVGCSLKRGATALPEKSPTLTHSRCKSGGHMLLPMQRHMTLNEIEELQGFPGGHLRIPAGVSKKKYAGMLGNAFTVSVIGRVALNLLKMVGKVPPEHFDPWAMPSMKHDFVDYSRFSGMKCRCVRRDGHTDS